MGRGKLRGKAARILLVAAFGVLAVGAGLAFRPVVYSLGDVTWGVGAASSPISLD